VMTHWLSCQPVDAPTALSSSSSLFHHARPVFADASSGEGRRRSHCCALRHVGPPRKCVVELRHTHCRLLRSASHVEEHEACCEGLVAQMTKCLADSPCRLLHFRLFRSAFLKVGYAGKRMRWRASFASPYSPLASAGYTFGLTAASR